MSALTIPSVYSTEPSPPSPSSSRCVGVRPFLALSSVVIALSVLVMAIWGKVAGGFFIAFGVALGSALFIVFQVSPSFRQRVQHIDMGGVQLVGLMFANQFFKIIPSRWLTFYVSLCLCVRTWRSGGIQAALSRQAEEYQTINRALESEVNTLRAMTIHLNEQFEKLLSLSAKTEEARANRDQALEKQKSVEEKIAECYENFGRLLKITDSLVKDETTKDFFATINKRESKLGELEKSFLETKKEFLPLITNFESLRKRLEGSLEECKKLEGSKRIAIAYLRGAA